MTFTKKGDKRPEKTKEKIGHGNFDTWNKKRDAFFASNPRCSVCHNRLTHVTKTGMCAQCRADFNTEKFDKKHPSYHKKYNHVRWFESKPVKK